MPDPAGGIVTNIPKTAGMTFGYLGAGTPRQPSNPQPIRQWDFPVGTNSSYQPRRSEPFSFAHLRAFSNVELVRIAIETRKDQLEKLDWQIKERDETTKGNYDAKIREITKFLEKPDGITPFASFMRALDEDLLSIDAATIETRRTRGGKLIGLDYVPGDTINRLVDDNGRVPTGPDDVAFQQIIKGVVWNNLSNRDVKYLPRNIRPGHIYGFSPVEQMIVTINTVLRRQASQLSYFTEGNVPAGFMTAPDSWNNDQIRDLQDWFDNRISGNQGAQRSIVWGPAGSKYQAFKDSPIKDEFDEWLARLISFAFSLPPTPFIRAMNKGTAGEDQERAEEEGLVPLKLWRKRWLDDLIATEFGAPELEYAYREERALDAKAQMEIDDKNIRNGSSTIDEVRSRRGEDPLPDNSGTRARIYLTSGVVPIDIADTIAQLQAQPQIAPSLPVHEGDAGAGAANAGNSLAAPQPANDDQAAPKPAASAKIGKAAKRSSTPDHALALSVDRPKALRASAALARAIVPIFAKASHDVAAQVERKIAKSKEDANSIVASLDLTYLQTIQADLEFELEEIGLDASSLALGAIGVDEAGGLVNRVNARAVAYARERAAELVNFEGERSLVESTRSMLRSIIAKGLEDNIGRNKIADNIQSSYAFSAQRSELIADNEIANANSAAKASAWSEVQAGGAVMVKQWFISGDEGVCPECEGNDSQGEIGFDESFESGDDFEPGHVGCRCVTVARVLDAGEIADDGTSAGDAE